MIRKLLTLAIVLIIGMSIGANAATITDFETGVDTIVGTITANTTNNHNLTINRYTWVTEGLFNLTDNEAYNWTWQCGQEQANVSTACGGLDNGTYTAAGDNWSTADNLVDGNWNTAAQAPYNGESIMYMNYSKPENSTGAIWRTKNTQWIGAPTTETNIPTTCWGYDNNRIILRGRSVWDPGEDSAYWECYNGSWIIVYFASAQSSLMWEENITWTMLESTRLLNPYITLGGTQVLDITGTFDYSNRTDDFYETIQTILPECSGGTLDGDNCIIPITVRSNQTGNYTLDNLLLTIPDYELNITFDNVTNVEVTDTEKVLRYEAVTNVTLPYGTLEGGLVRITWNNNLQRFDYTNIFNYTSIQVEAKVVEGLNLVQQIRVWDGEDTIQDVNVKIYENVGANDQIIYQGQTDFTGTVKAQLKDASTYFIEASKDGYDTTVSIVYIPPGNTETIYMTLEEATPTTEYEYYATHYGTIEEAINITYYVQRIIDADELLYINYAIIGGTNTTGSINDTSTNVVGLELQSSLLNSTITNVYVNVTIGGVKTWEWNEEVNIQGADRYDVGFELGDITGYEQPLLFFGFLTAAITSGVVEKKFAGMGMFLFAGWLGLLSLIWPVLIIFPIMIIAYKIWDYGRKHLE